MGDTVSECPPWPVSAAVEEVEVGRREVTRVSQGLSFYFSFLTST